MKIYARVALLVACAVAFPCAAFSAENKTFQTEVNHSVKSNELVFVLESYLDENETCFTKSIEVKDANDGKTIQKLAMNEFNDGEDAMCAAKDALELGFEDMNFDGFDDLNIQAFVPAGPNIPRIYWLWNDGKKQFVYDEVLSALPSLEIDNENKTLSSESRNSASGYRYEFYKYMDGKLTLFKATDKEYLDDNMVEIITWELKNGELAETGREKKIAE